MSRTELLLSPTPPAMEHSAASAKGCRFASNCNCIFAPAEEALPSQLRAAGMLVDAPTTEASSRDTVSEIDAEIAVLLQRGWQVASSDDHSITLTRRRSMPFCTNVALLLVTGFLWSIYLVARARHPKVETTVLTF